MFKQARGLGVFDHELQGFGDLFAVLAAIGRVARGHERQGTHAHQAEIV